MNRVVITALRRPYTFVVLSVLIIIFGVRAAITTPTDVFPSIKIPVVAVIWSYLGLMPQDMSGRIVYYYERALTTTVNNIEHIESGSYYGRGIVKVFFQPGANVSTAQTQITSVSQTIIKQLPQGATPPLILAYDASSVPVLTLQINSETMNGADLYNMASNLIRPQLVSIPGVAIPAPYGGLAPYITVDIVPSKLMAHNLSAVDVGNALNQQNIVLPAGDQRIGPYDYMVETNAQPKEIEAFNNLPLKQVGNAVVYLRDVANVHPGGPPQTNMVLVKGRQSVMMVIMKSGDASTLSVVSGVKSLLPQISESLPKGTKIKILTDASKFVKDSVEDVVREMVIAALLTSLAVMLFLGSWRSTLIVSTSIPLAILTSLIFLQLFGQSINVMTLGGLALAVGILVDDATVMVENIDAHLEMGKDLEIAIIDAANQIVIPTFVSTTCICIVWFPLFELTGVAGWLFMPMAEAIIFAIAASFILSRTLVPTMAKYLLAGHDKAQEHPADHHTTGFFTRFQKRFEEGFKDLRDRYEVLLGHLIESRQVFIPCFLAISVASMGLYFFVGRDFFPEIKSGTLQLHMRAPVGTRLEESGKIASLIEKKMHEVLPGKIDSVLSNCGLPFSQMNQAFIPSPTLGTEDCDITVSLKNDESPIASYRTELRAALSDAFPGTQITFQPADLTAKILNFGLPAPIDVQVVGRDLFGNYEFAKKLKKELLTVPGLADLSIQQPTTKPTIRVAAQRSFAMGTGITEEDVARNELVALSGSAQVGQVYWLSPQGIARLIDVQVPATYLQTLNDLETLPIDKGDGNPENKPPQLLGALAKISMTGTPAQVSHYNIIPVFDIYGSNEGLDLGRVVDEVKKVTDSMRSQLPRGSHIVVRGQAVTMVDAYAQLITGLILSVVLVYLVIVVNFQSWLDPFVIITALPGALAGIAWSLFLTHTTLSVPALTGAIMCMGTSTANAILVVAFARERLEIHGDALKAALEAGYERIRPVIMTALAMIVGMIPMSISNSDNAPIGKAVIGGLLVATVATLLFVPCVFAMVHHRRAEPTAEKGVRT